MARQRGNDWQLSVGTTDPATNVLALEVGHDFNVQAEQIDATSKGDGDYGFFLAGTKNGEIPFSARLDETQTNDYFTLLSWFNSNSQVYYLITNSVTGDSTIAGTATITDLNMSNQNNAAVEITGTLQLQGAPTIGTVV